MFIYYLNSMLLLLFSLLFFNLSINMLFFNNSMFINWNIYKLMSTQINMLIFLDWISMMFMFTVLMISSMILFYSSEYMLHDNNKISFFFLMILFMLSMIFMVISPNLISILLGWDGLGLISYCLVIFYQSKYSYSSGNLTILSNRIGDITLILSISLMFNMGNWNFLLMFNKNNNLFMLLLLIIITAFTKSAQFPFSAWLPVAMAAPTPVSSLVHSSTLVTAGIYLLIRFNKLLFNYKNLLLLILYTSMITMMMAGMSALFEFDFKKIIAYSTLSQLSIMMMIYSIKLINLSYFHLIIHAMFKSMMFMCSGIFIHNLINYQDIRFFGNLNKLMPLSCSMFFISNMSLCGIPFMSGFFSKDLILETMLMNKLNLLIFILMIFSTMLTLMYSIRLFFFLIFNKFNFLNYFLIKDSKMMNFSMFILLYLSIIFGMILNWIIFFSIEYIYLNIYFKLMIFNSLMFSLLLSKFLFKFFNYKFTYKFSMFFGKMWFMYNLINLLLNLLKFGNYNFKYLDKGWLEFLFKKSMNLLISKNSLMKLMNNNMFKMLIMTNYFMISILFLY